MSNKNCVVISENDRNEACDALLIGNHVNTLSMNQQMVMNVERFGSSSTSPPPPQSSSSSSLSLSRHTASNRNSTENCDEPFINGDLIDLCDREHLSGSNQDLVEAINSQLLAEITEKSQATRDCHMLNPTKVSFDNKLSGTKLNYANNLNNSIDMSASTSSARSSETIGGKCSESNNNASTNEQHQTVIREFKRLGTYCTLRPEQRRKHLLKVLPTLRNSMLLQTLLVSNAITSKNLTKISNSCTADELLATNTDIDSLLVDLDDFIIGGNTTLMQRHSNEHFNSSESFTSSNCDGRSQRSFKTDATTSITTPCYAAANLDEINNSCIQIDPDKVEDCLLELDAYLEEIDRDYVVACAAHGPTSSSSSQQPIHSNTIGSLTNMAKSAKISANLTNYCSEKTSKIHNDRLHGGDKSNDYNGESSSSAATQYDQLSIDYSRSISASNLRKQISNSDIQMNLCGKSSDANEPNNNGSRITDNKRKSNDNASNQPLKRGHKLRNTVAISGPNRTTIPSTNGAVSQNVDNSVQKMRTKNAALSWRRQSMRKTCPIMMPEQNLPRDLVQYASREQRLARTLSSANRSTSLSPSTSADCATNGFSNNFSSISNADENNENYCFNETIASSMKPSTNGCLLSNSENNQMSSTTNVQYDHHHVHSNQYDSPNQLPELSSLNNEILNTILTTQSVANSSANNQVSAVQHETHFGHNIEEDSGGHATPFEESRPRQLGRRSEMRSRIVSITAERNAEGNQRIIVNCDTDNVQCATQPSCSTSPTPATVAVAAAAAATTTTSPASPTSNQSNPVQTSLQRLSNQCQFAASDDESRSGASSRNPSPVSIASSSESSSGGSTSAGETNIGTTTHRTMNGASDMDTPSSSSNRTANNSQRQINSKTTVWPFGFSRIFAATCCTLGLFNISRFSIFSIIFGANFIVQFLLLSFFLGIPMLWLQMCLGANIKGGPIQMWRVSPICKGIGFALVLVQALMTIYSAVSIAWMLVYLRDSCVSARYPWYRWQEIFEFFRGPSDNGIAIMSNTSEPSSTSSKLGETVADYFNGVIMQRYQLGPGGRISSFNGLGAVRFQLAFNLSVVWLIVFVVLCKGLRFYGKIVIALATLPLVAFFALTIKMLTLLNFSGFQNIFPATDWQDFFLNSQSWLSAAQEAFLTWSLLGASIISIFSKPAKHQQDGDKVLRRDALLVVAFTLIGLLLAAVFGNACVQILNDRGFFYFPGSFETITSSVSLLPSSKPLPPQLATSLSKWLPRYSTLLGESYKRIDPNSFESGWQPIRLITEIFPATLAAATLENISSFWSLLGFSTFLCFGLAQLCVMWKPLANSLCNYSESISATSTTVLLTCLAGLLLGIPLTTECGINIIYFLDSVIGGAWFVLLLWTGQIFAVFLVRGRPYSGDMLVNRLHLGLTFSAFVALSWNLLLPIGLLTLCVLQYKISYSYDFYHWSGIISQSYWPIWTRKAAAFIQIGIFQIIPITAIVQTYRYLSKGPPDILDRFQLLYRPPISSSQRSHRYPHSRTDRTAHATSNRQSDSGTGSTSIPAIAVTLDSSPVSLTLDDAPPKYTPPPSYTTATGARIAKLLRNSIRRSVRRILGDPNCNNNHRQRAALPTHTVESSFDQNPPEYSTIMSIGLATTSNQDHVDSSAIDSNEFGPRVLFNSETYRHQIVNTRRHTTTNFPSQKSLEKMDSFSLTMPRRQNTAISSISNERTHFRNLTAHDVAQLLRSNAQQPHSLNDLNPDALAPSSLDSSIFPIHSDCIINSDHNSDIGQEHEDFSLTRSVEELVLNEVPIGESNAAATLCDKNNN